MRRLAEQQKIRLGVCSGLITLTILVGIASSKLNVRTTANPLNLGLPTPQPTTSMPPELRDSINREAIYGLSNDGLREP